MHGLPAANRSARHGALPYVIDNQAHRLADVLRELLAAHGGKSLDVASAYFTVAAFGIVRDWARASPPGTRLPDCQRQALDLSKMPIA